jgi:hypothetical protein
VRTTESILADLTVERDDHEKAGRLAEVERVNQQVIAHETLARLRAESATPGSDVDELIAFWARMVDVDVDEPAPAAAPTVLVDLPPVDVAPPAEPTV